MAQMVYRARARCRFTGTSGLAGWCHEQMTVRYGQSVVIRDGQPAQENPVNETPEPGLFVCDLLLADRAAAEDAFVTLADHNVLGQALLLDEDEQERSWVDIVACDHQFDERDGSVVLDKAFGPAVVSGVTEWQPGLVLAVDDEVTYDGVTYRVVQAHTTQPGWEPPNVPALFEVVA